MIFYAYFHVSYLLILIFSIVINFAFSKVMLVNLKCAKPVLVLGILLNVGVILYFKYFDFFIENINSAFGLSVRALNILMPLGISFFTFQQISFLADSYKGETKDYSFLEYALFVSFFPQLIAGPIVLHNEMIPQFKDLSGKKLNPNNLAEGIYRFSIGLAKKVLLADTLAKGVDWGYENYAVLNGFDLFVIAVFYSFQLYFDFSGYCDMACGIAKCLNLSLPENFNSPYKAVSIIDFWKRWHMSLTRFLTKYIYIPLGGNRKGKARKLLNILIVFLISGIWHGANWTFILWGLIHGILYILCSVFGFIWDKIWKPVRIGINYFLVTIAWIFFRADNLKIATDFIRNIFMKPSLTLSGEFVHKFDILELTYPESHISILERFVSQVPQLNLCIIGIVCALIVFTSRNMSEKRNRLDVKRGIFCGCLMVWSVLSLSGVSTFLYFNF